MNGASLPGRIAAAAFALAVVGLLHTQSAAERISVRTFPVPLNSGDPDERKVGELTFLGGLELRSPAEGFGGFSGLHISPGGRRMLAISDMGYWLQARLVHDADGALTDIENVRLTPMLGPDGEPVTGKARGDAEGLAVTEEGILVSFEGRPRVWRYPDTKDLSAAVPEALPLPAGMKAVKRNKGLESLVALPGGALLLLTEETLDGDGHIRGWLGGPGSKHYAPLRVRRTPPFAVTDAALLPGKRDLLILERRYSLLAGLGIKLRRVPVSAVKPGALLDGRRVAEFSPGQTIDNFEGLGVRAGRSGPMVYLLSDDNYSGFQRTLLFNFRLDSSVPAAH
ncbi:MAG: esterase-like activity of phytase family protein [Alphaproteobacteria bacterium]